MKNKTDAIEDLAQCIIFGTVSQNTLIALGLNLKEGKSFTDVLEAGHLKAGQPPGDFERMVAHVENNLAEVIA